MPGMLFVVCVPTAATERRLRQELPSLAKGSKPANEQVPLEQMLEDLLRKLEVEHSVWNSDKGGTYYQVVFPTGTGDPCENCLHCLSQLGIGKKFNSTVSVAPCNVYLQGVAGDPDVDDGEDEDESEMAKRWNNFVQGIRSKLTVKHVVDGVRSGAECSFDYMTLVLTADMIAAVGLIENNSVNIVAAMLVSPLMGPIMAVTFGVIIADWKLVRIGVVSEAVGMTISLVFGFIFGLLVASACNDFPWGLGHVDWPTPEMKGRGNYRSLWIGILWALPSGTGVALALLQGSAGPLIGVAISASLLPPLVNCGMMWAMACIWLAHEGMKFPYIQGEPFDTDNFTSALYQPIYSEWMPSEFACMGIVSFCLTLINFCCIFITAIVVLKIKEVAAPYVSPPDLRRFWEHDLRAVRASNRSTLRRSRRARPSRVDKDLMNDIRSIPEEELGETLEEAVREAMDDSTFRTVERCSFQAANADMARALGLTGGGGVRSGSVRRSSTGVRTSVNASDAAPLSDPQVLDQLICSLLGHQQQQQQAHEGGDAPAHRRPLSRSLRQSSARSLRSGRGSLRNSLMHGTHSPSRNSGLPTILEGGKRASLTDRALAASRSALQALGTPPRRHSRHGRGAAAPPPPPPEARYHRRSSDTVSLTRSEDA